MAASAPTSAETVTSRPILPVPMPNAGWSCTAMAPTELMSAALSPSTIPRRVITVRRAGPPSWSVSRSSARCARRPSHGRTYLLQMGCRGACLSCGCGPVSVSLGILPHHGRSGRRSR